MRTDVPPWAPPLMAVQFLTRLPVPLVRRLSDDQARAALAQATGWLPLVGTAIGLVTAGVYLAAIQLWPPLVAALVALGVEAWLTGAFHEDAAADFCDAFGGGARGADALRILKDSRIGSYGALGLLVLVGTRAAATAALPVGAMLAGIVAAATVARLWAVVLLALCPPTTIGRGGLAKDIGRLPRRILWVAALSSLPGIALLAVRAPLAIVVAIAAGVVILPWLARLLRIRIGGSTGDCLGFAAYVGQLVVLLAACAR